MSLPSFAHILPDELPNLPRAACKHANPEVFFPAPSTETGWRRRHHAGEQARSYCGPCPERLACLAWALDHPAVEGIWGGLSDRERTTLRRKQSEGAA